MGPPCSDDGSDPEDAPEPRHRRECQRDSGKIHLAADVTGVIAPPPPPGRF